MSELENTALLFQTQQDGLFHNFQHVLVPYVVIDVAAAVSTPNIPAILALTNDYQSYMGGIP